MPDDLIRAQGYRNLAEEMELLAQSEPDEKRRRSFLASQSSTANLRKEWLTAVPSLDWISDELAT
jgi:hypothetical protein